MPAAQLGAKVCTRCIIRVSRLRITTGAHRHRGGRLVYVATPFTFTNQQSWQRTYSTAALAERDSYSKYNIYNRDSNWTRTTSSSLQSTSSVDPLDPQSSPPKHSRINEENPSPAYSNSPCPFIFENGFALHAKRKHNPRPFPPPFLSAPSGSFSDPLSTHNRPPSSNSDDEGGLKLPKRKATDGNGRLLLGLTNGDDAVALNNRFIAANDGVGAWATREKGNAALWARLVVHFWAVEAENDRFGDKISTSKDAESTAKSSEDECPTSKNPSPNPVAYLQSAYESTISATESPEIHGTTTASGALLSYSSFPSDENCELAARPILYVTQLGDSQIMVIRPKDREVIYRTSEQWHWFDCPRQLGTNSPDTPTQNAVVDRVENLEEGDVVLAMSDGVGDNLWEHEIMACVVDALQRWDMTKTEDDRNALEEGVDIDGLGRDMADSKEMATTEEMMYVARELVRAARVIAEDPFAESPYMEKAIDEGLSIDGGKRDDISVVAAKCVRVGEGP